MDGRKLAHFKSILEQRLHVLERRLEGIEEALDETPAADDEERATERELDEVMEGLGNAGLQEIEQIKVALHRIDAGDFGVCAHCGKNIELARLEAIPHAARCAVCA